MKKKYLICGVSGYLGQNLCDYLIHQGACVTGIDRNAWAGEEYENFTFLQADLTDASFFQTLPDDYDAVFFMTGLSGAAKSFSHYEDFIRINELSLLHLLNTLSSRRNKPRIIFPSTRLVYSGDHLLLSEGAPKESKTVYAANKIACEAFLDAYHNAFDIDYRVLRICVPYGNLPGRSYSYGTIGFFLRQAQHGEITLYGDGSLRRTFTHVKDICMQLHTLSETDDAVHFIYNSCGEDFSLLEVAQMIATKLQAKIRFCPFPEFDSRLESGDTVFSETLLRKILPDPVKYSLQNFLSEI